MLNVGQCDEINFEDAKSTDQSCQIFVNYLEAHTITLRLIWILTNQIDDLYAQNFASKHFNRSQRCQSHSKENIVRRSFRPSVLITLLEHLLV